MTRTEDEGLMSLLSKSVSHSLTLSITACVTIFHSSKDGEGRYGEDRGRRLDVHPQRGQRRQRQASKHFELRKFELIVAYVAY